MIWLRFAFKAKFLKLTFDNLGELITERRKFYVVGNGKYLPQRR